MMKKQVRVATILLVVFLMVSISVNVVLAIDNTQSEPGSDQDPLVSRSYVDSTAAKNDAVIKQLQADMENLKSKLGQTGGGSEGFNVVELEAGSIIYTGSGTEIVLRSGKAVAVKGQDGGLADVTGAKDLTSGAVAAANHLLISSRDDKRGLKASIKSYLLVRGTYSIEKSAAAVVTEPVQDNAGQDADQNAGQGTGQAAVKTATVNVASLNIRTGPGTENKLAGSAVKGEKVSVLEQNGEWSRIKKSNGVEGWVLSKYIAL